MTMNANEKWWTKYIKQWNPSILTWTVCSVRFYRSSVWVYLVLLSVVVGLTIMKTNTEIKPERIIRARKCTFVREWDDDDDEDDDDHDEIN